MSRPAPTFGEPSALAAAMEAAARPAVAAPVAESGYKPLIGRSTPIVVEWTNPETGELKSWSGHAAIPVNAETSRGRIVAALTGGVAWEALPADLRGLAVARAYCATGLASPPPWLIDAASNDPALAMRLGGALAAHEQAFFLADDGSGDATTRRCAVRMVALDAGADTRGP